MEESDPETTFRHLAQTWLATPEHLPASLRALDLSDLCLWMSLEGHAETLRDLRAAVGDPQLATWLADEIATAVKRF
ncbi:hypothetical protein ROJ8625_00301 [Roseivivax jejudonensis]|uniref:Uncharacterized protein n=1 Tax=Roseivivax jejudonensis TaxID=1529041 RepID=A0A1X6Y6F3_9RHOB|nr:hypothetical protein [Roseivivax jejudonensis]SLN12025.1 hypothetical protein ROJ8625_00301 [Roseivivax jejudonensis]